MTKPTKKNKWEEELKVKTIFAILDPSTTSLTQEQIDGFERGMINFIAKTIQQERRAEREEVIKIGEKVIDGCIKKKCFKDHEAIKDLLEKLRNL